jgi:hypothetical protein
MNDISWIDRRFRPSGASASNRPLPTAYAVGYILSPPRSWAQWDRKGPKYRSIHQLTNPP